MAMEGTGLARYFKLLVCAEDVTEGKPAPDCFLLVSVVVMTAPLFFFGGGCTTRTQDIFSVSNTTWTQAAKQLGVDAAGCIGFEDGTLGLQSIRAAGYLKACDVRTWPGYPSPSF